MKVNEISGEAGVAEVTPVFPYLSVIRFGKWDSANSISTS